MEHDSQVTDRRTSVDVVFDSLYQDIASLQLLPGTKISEVEIAKRFGVSRQPVRDAFGRLENQGLLLIRPQKATEVKRFSLKAIEKSRFVRGAIEADVLRRAAAECDQVGQSLLDECLEAQRDVVAKGDYKAFGKLDYKFHQTLCGIANVDFAFEVISEEKAKVDRLCTLGLAAEDRMPQLLEDHINISDKIKQGDAEGAAKAGMAHLSRLDSTIATISRTKSDYFDP